MAEIETNGEKQLSRRRFLEFVGKSVAVTGLGVVLALTGRASVSSAQSCCETCETCETCEVCDGCFTCETCDSCHEACNTMCHDSCHAVDPNAP